jgi:hypothetical protein
MFTPHEQHVRGFVFWTLAPFLVAIVVLMPLLAQRHDAGGIVAIAAIELLAILVLIGLFDPIRFSWAWRAAGAIVFLGYSACVATMLIESDGVIAITPRKSEASAFNAICGLIVFGIPGLCYALFGRITIRRCEPSDDANSSDIDD